jgi:predicted acylesterase/phospholipase RssA
VRSARTIAVIPAGAGRMPSDFLPAFEAALSAEKGNVLCLRRGDAGAALAHLDEEGSGLLMSWLYDNETAFRFIILEGDAEPTAWTLRAMRQADLILSVALSTEDAAPSPLERIIAGDPMLQRVRRELVLLHAPETALPRGTAIWLNERPRVRHHHLRRGSTEDFARLARWVSGRSLGLVLSGGAARAFAHIGTLKALRDLGLPADFICGSSMGAIIGGQAALGWDIETMMARNKVVFAQWSIGRNLTYPYVALQTGRSMVRLAHDVFGDSQVEDLWLPYFCVSTNLSRAEVVAHETGPLWLWTRSSVSLPGIVPPVVYNGDLLVDGGVLNNLPIDLMRQRCPGPIIAVDVSPAVEMTTTMEVCAEMHGWPHLWRSVASRRQAGFPNIMEILMRAATLGASTTSKRNQSAADLYLHPPVEGFAGFGWSALERIVDIGYRHSLEHIAAWQVRRATEDDEVERALQSSDHR